MSYVRVETSVPRHPKFLRAGPAACWLWLCGVAYCQDALTDGFIATEAIGTLGVSKPLLLAAVLVSVGLWHAREDGWQVHDYLDHNNSAEYVRKVKADRREAGKRGGRPQTKQRAVGLVKQLALGLLWHTRKQTVNPSVQTAVQTATTVPVQNEKQERGEPPTLAVENERIDRLNERIRHHRRRRSRETDTGRPAETVITALARDVLTSHPNETDDSELRELLKTACARANLHYDGRTVGNALETAKAQVRKAVG